MNEYKHRKTSWSILLVFLLSMLQLSSCDELIEDRYGYLAGQWRVVEVNSWGNCPYQVGDNWMFYDDGRFEAYGSHAFHEYGYWRANGRNVEIVFEPYNDVSIQIYIDNYQGDYLSMKVNDYSNDTYYTLRFVRYY